MQVRTVASEMNKCLTLVHLTSTLRIHSGVQGAAKATNRCRSNLATEPIGCLQRVGLAPAAIAAIAAIAQHWRRWRWEYSVGSFALQVDWT